ncbi:MAG TPA: choice-of-anchor L domain-containing protein, partial [Gemmatimonadaceae bacterium]|nr:choice-of-anchor L domain-containing protein [Gemmatimonadaceae bacterium]
QLAQTLAGAGVTVSNVTYTGADSAAGTFSGGADIVGFESGIILSSGYISNVVGPNTIGSVTGSNGTPGDAGLDELTGAGNATQDAAILSFDFVPDGDSVKFQYVFASDEYNEYVNTEYNDVFAFYVNGKNCALVGDPAVPVTINTINNGNPFGSTPNSHPELYRNNDLEDGGATINTEMDGLTKVLTCSAAVNAGVTNTMRLAIADASDDAFDSNVFLSAKSLTVKNQPPTAAISVPSTGDSFAQGASVSFAGSGTDAEDGSLTGGSLVWSSSKDGQIGTGTSFSTSGLSVGTHTITLTATDSKGATGTASIQVTIESGGTSENQTPTVSITAPADGFEVLQGSSLAFTGSGNDAEDGALTGGSLVWTSDKDGQIGTGTSFSTTALSLGVHTITLTGKDSQGATATATIAVNVGYSKTMGPDGGDVCAVGCQVLIFIPKGALAAQTTVTVFFAPDAPSGEGMIPGSARTVGPADLSFVTPADMGMIYDPATLPSGVTESQLRLFRYNGTSWEPISGSVVNTGTHVVSAFINSGGTYAIFAVED